MVLALAFALVALSGVAYFVDHTRQLRQERHRTDAAAVNSADDPWPECAAIRKDLLGKEIVAWERRGVLDTTGQTMVKVHSRDDSNTKPRRDYYTTIGFSTNSVPGRESISWEIWGPSEEYFWTPRIVFVLLDLVRRPD